MKFALSTNEKFKNKPRAKKDDLAHRNQFRIVNANFRNRLYTQHEIIESIKSGYAYCAQLYNGYRTSRNFKMAQHIGFDLDHLPIPIEEIEDPLITKFASFLHTTSSDSPERPRSRVVFFALNSY